MNQFIVIDGLDGSGKATQAKLLADSYKENGIPNRLLSFPDYKSKSSTLVKMYLQGELSSDPSDVNPYAAASFYACDRYIGFLTDWEKDYHKGSILIADRYVSSNAIHQMVKLPRDEWDGFLNWINEYEYDKLGLPMPSIVIYLDMLPEVSQKLISHRYDGDMGKKDIHEKNQAYLVACREAALYAAEKQNWVVIRCDDGKSPYSIEDIFERIQSEVKG